MPVSWNRYEVGLDYFCFEKFCFVIVDFDSCVRNLTFFRVKNLSRLLFGLDVQKWRHKPFFAHDLHNWTSQFLFCSWTHKWCHKPCFALDVQKLRHKYFFTHDLHKCRHKPFFCIGRTTMTSHVLRKVEFSSVYNSFSENINCKIPSTTILC